MMRHKMKSHCLTSLLTLLTLLCPTTLWADVDYWAESYRLESLTQYGAAIKSMDAILKKDSGNEFAVLRHGWLSYLQGDHSAAITDYKKAMKLNKQSLDAKLGIMLPLLAQQRWHEAASYANTVLKVAPWNYYAHLRLMITEEGSRQWDTLATHAKKVHQRYPSETDALVYMARAYRWLNDTKSARKAYKKVLERFPSHIEATQFIIGNSAPPMNR